VLNFYLVATETIKPLVFALPNRFAGLYTTFFASTTSDRADGNNCVSEALSLQRMANELEAVQPSLAAELRAFAARA